MQRALAGILLWVAPGWTPGARGAEATVNTEKGCLVELAVERGRSPWAGFTGSHLEEAAGHRVRAVADLRDLEVPPHLERMGSAPLLAINRAQRSVVISAAHFSDLVRPDATQLAVGQRAVMGTLKGAALAAPPRDVARFLVASELVRTYAHLEARLCLHAEENVKDRYVAHFRGEHTYFTSKRHQDRYAFRIELSRTTGEISVVGEAP